MVPSCRAPGLCSFGNLPSLALLCGALGSAGENCGGQLRPQATSQLQNTKSNCWEEKSSSSLEGGERELISVHV